MKETGLMMTYRNAVRNLILLCAAMLLTAGCATMQGEQKFAYKDLPVSKSNAASGQGNTVAFRGAPMKLEGTPIRVGDTVRDAKLATRDLKLTSLPETQGKVRIVSIVPSIDTKVCEQQTHYLSEKNGGLSESVQLITISVDTPFAQKRFAEEAKISNVTFLSDYRGGDFGRAHGLLVPNIHVLARSVMVLDKDNVIRYLQVVPELATLPDMDAAFKTAREIAGIPATKTSAAGTTGWSY
jgi:thiol peroxidase